MIRPVLAMVGACLLGACDEEGQRAEAAPATSSHATAGPTSFGWPSPPSDPAASPACAPAPGASTPPPITDPEFTAAMRAGLTAWRAPGPRGACASCHGPDGFDLARLGFTDGDILRHASLEGAPAGEAPRILAMVHALRRRYAIAPCDPRAPVFRSGAQAGVAARPWAGRRPNPGWLPDRAREPLAAERGALYALHDAYLADPTWTNLWRIYDAVPPAASAADPAEGRALARYRAVLVAQHMMRVDAFELPPEAARRGALRVDPEGAPPAPSHDGASPRGARHRLALR